MNKLILVFLLVQVPLFIFCQTSGPQRHCLYDDYSLTMSYNVCTNDDTTGFIPFISDDNLNVYQMNVYKVQYHLHFSALDTVFLNIPDTGRLVRFWYTDALGKVSMIDQTTFEYYNCDKFFKNLNTVIWEVVSNWRFYITDFSAGILDPYPRNIEIDIPIIIKQQ